MNNSFEWIFWNLKNEYLLWMNILDVCLLSSTAIKGWKSQHWFIWRVLSPSGPFQALQIVKDSVWLCWLCRIATRCAKTRTAAQTSRGTVPLQRCSLRPWHSTFFTFISGLPQFLLLVLIVHQQGVQLRVFLRRATLQASSREFVGAVFPLPVLVQCGNIAIQLPSESMPQV